ncbi:hypothetical protein HPHPP15B_0005 [Helicobacter pylori Hp P-15b]|uniref:Uncharacterized protein n=3 Tax=Helicobacter pylori TaxID=210 RepID=J0QCQ4_HELPX|nr:hypothetical protein HPHPP15_0545 [Helicobacter pylori Hp P-15]EJC30303.1 hypothetical protein HPHPP15B_1715 [Helicobacter pylori Hp P-15b]EJC08938.1 hypothetical protein HPHPP15_0003 [Helicobacter pylori Hp P-15]EJC31175.1 hypothetical protein HPHPP15B_1637 [Helicobacter pylori Hp P-15b]EJC33166.1 hypothetical protein HPHPP15B_0548 [Helicobacter pylori Hp P-15b]
MVNDAFLFYDAFDFAFLFFNDAFDFLMMMRFNLMMMRFILKLYFTTPHSYHFQ